MAEQLSLQINIGGKEQLLTSFGEIKKAIKDAEFQALALSQQFGESDKRVLVLREEIGNLKDTIEDSTAATKNYAGASAIFPALAKSVQGIASGFTAVQGAMGLLGVESKDVEKTLLKVQSAMALSQGIGSLIEAKDAFVNLGGVIKNSTAFIKLNELANKAAAGAMKLFGVAVETTSTSFKVLKGVIAATGIGLLVVAVGELVSAFQDYQGAAEKAKKSQEDLNKTIQSGAKTALQAELASIEQTGKLLVAQAKAKGASEKEILEIENQTRRLRISAQNRYHEEIKKIDLEAAMEAEKEVKNQQTDIQIANLGYAANQLKARQEANKKIIEEEKAREEKLEEGRLKARKAGEAFTNLVLDNKEKQKQKDKEDAEKQAEIDDANIAAQFAKQDAIDEALLAKKSKKAIEDKKFKEDDLKGTIELEDAKLAVVEGALQLAMGLAGKNKAIADAIFIVDKGLAIARIIVDTQREIAGYAANPLWTALPDGGALIKGKYILGAKLRAGASIATIAATTIGKFTTGSTQGFGGGAGTLGLSAPLQPQGQQAQLTQLNQSSINALGNQAMRAYVVETDVTTSQQRIAAIQQRARFS
jgi:hypothetical protein